MIGVISVYKFYPIVRCVFILLPLWLKEVMISSLMIYLLLLRSRDQQRWAKIIQMIYMRTLVATPRQLNWLNYVRRHTYTHNVLEGEKNTAPALSWKMCRRKSVLENGIISEQTQKDDGVWKRSEAAGVYFCVMHRKNSGGFSLIVILVLKK